MAAMKACARYAKSTRRIQFLVSDSQSSNAVCLRQTKHKDALRTSHHRRSLSFALLYAAVTMILNPQDGHAGITVVGIHQVLYPYSDVSGRIVDPGQIETTDYEGPTFSAEAATASFSITPSGTDNNQSFRFVGSTHVSVPVSEDYEGQNVGQALGYQQLTIHSDSPITVQFVGTLTAAAKTTSTSTQNAASEFLVDYWGLRDPGIEHRGTLSSATVRFQFSLPVRPACFNRNPV